jgi:hypothetical protein
MTAVIPSMPLALRLISLKQRGVWQSRKFHVFFCASAMIFACCLEDGPLTDRCFLRSGLRSCTTLKRLLALIRRLIELGALSV